MPGTSESAEAPQATPGAASAKSSSSADPGPQRATERKLVADSLVTYGAELAYSLLLFVNGVITARFLGPDGRGIYAVVLMVPGTICALGHLGLFQGLVHNTIKDPAGEGRRAVNVGLVSFALGTVLAAISLTVFVAQPFDELQAVTPLMVALAVASPYAILFNSYARALVLGRDDLVKRNLVRIVEPGTFLVLAVVLVVGLRYGVTGAIIASACSQWVISLLSLSYILPAARQAGIRPDFGRLRADMAYGLQSYGGAVAVFAVNQLDAVMVAYFLPPAEVGRYAVAYTMIMILSILPAAVQASFLPKVTQRYYADGHQESMTPFVCRVMLALAGATGVLAALGVYPLIWIFYGKEFLPSAAPFLIMLPGVICVSGLSVLASALQARSRQKWIAISAGVGVVVNLGLDLVLIPAFGIQGAAFASSVAYLVMISMGAWAFLQVEPELRPRDILVPTRHDVRRLAMAVGDQVTRLRARWLASRA